MTTRPRPILDAVNAAYWEAAREHRFVLIRCDACGKYVHPPRPACPRCQSESLVPTEVSGNGTVYSFGVMHRGGNPGFDEKVPFAVVVVELDEEERLLTVGNMPDCPVDDIEIGMRVTVTFEDLDDEITLPQWTRAS